MTQQFPDSKNLTPTALEHEILKWWDDHRIFEQCERQHCDGANFSFYEGPPTANGRPGIHHVLGRTIKDVFCRYRTLKGYRVERKAGWDTHGLPVEIEVERALGLDGREQLEDYGIERFNRACRESVATYQRDWDELTRRIGYWVDLEQPYVTYHTPYIESVWWLLKQIYAKGLLYRGHKIQWYSPGSGTVLSSHEVSLGYQEITDPSAYVRFRSDAEPNLCFLAWTTTPWTLIANMALAVGPEIDYVKVGIKAAGAEERQQLILAAARLDALTEEYSVVAEFKGKDLLGRRYEPLFELPGADADGQSFRIVAGDYVSTEEGTGIVHIAPAFGAEDYELGRQENLPLINPIGPDGRFLPHAPVVAGEWFRDANKLINRDLRARGLLYREMSYLHNYPHDWRKGTPLMSYPVEGWFIRTTAIKDRLVALNNTINWYPPAIKEGRFGNWLENNVDWALSRKRYWGTPLPIWVSDQRDSGYFEVIGSIAELREKCAQVLPDDDHLDLHRPYVDELTWEAPDGGTMRRVPDVMDVWFDSGAMPVAQWHYPFENKVAFEKNFPADFICEGVDQTRGWFYTLHAIAALVMDEVAFKNVVVNGLILDEKGEKMSKSKGNTVDPFVTVEQHGADVVRWYMMSNSPPWDAMKFSPRGLTATRNKFFSTLENVYRFMASYANIDGFRYAEAQIPVADRLELDRWILSRLHSTVGAADSAYHDYDATRAARALEQFVDELSNWYVRRSRPRFWAAKKTSGGNELSVSEHAKLCAYQTTYECLLAVAKAMSPIAPFFSEWLYRALNETTALASAPSVHMVTFPIAEPAYIDTDLEQRMGVARTVVSLVLLLRNRARLNVRQPLARILVVTGPAGVDANVVDAVRDVVLDEVNIKTIEYIDDAASVVKRAGKANFQRLGPRLGKQMKHIAALIADLPEDDIAALLANGSLVLALADEKVSIDLDDVEIRSEELGDWIVAQEGTVTVALDTQVDETLKAEGLARELVNRIQNMRKAIDLELTQRIEVELVTTDAVLTDAVHTHMDYIKREVLAAALGITTTLADQRWDGVEEFTINDEAVKVAVQCV